MVINSIIGVYIAIIRIPDFRWDDPPQYRELLDPGTYPLIHFFIVWGFLLPFLELVCLGSGMQVEMFLKIHNVNLGGFK